MRAARIRLDRWEPTYYHCVSRVVGEPGYLPFGDVEKEKLFTLLESLAVFYSVEVIGFTVMSNHFHLVCAARPEPPPMDEVRRRWRLFHGPDAVEPRWDDPAVSGRVAERMRDMSRLLKDLQQRFSYWFNRTRATPRCGHLWADRFKSVVLEGGEALWNCLKYIELNPVRAGICSTPEEYHFSSWGRFSGAGVHPFAVNFITHFRRFIGERAADWDDAQVAAEFGSSMASQVAAEAGAPPEEIHAAGENARKRPRFRTMLMRRTRYWVDGAVIGSKIFLREVESRIRGSGRHIKRFESSDSPLIYSYRQLRI